MADTRTETLVAEFLCALGFSVSRVPRSDKERRPDFIVSKDQEVYVVEERSKETLRLFDQAEMQAKRYGVGCAAEDVKPSNTLSGIVHSKEGQLTDGGSPDAFRILWVSCMRPGAAHMFDLMRRTLYGLAYVSAWSATTGDMLKASVPCYYYYSNTFFGSPWLDAAVLWSGSLWALCVNEFSSHAHALRGSTLYRLFAEGGGLVDPQIIEGAGAAFFIRGAVDRADERAKWNYLLRECGCRTSLLTGSAFVGMIDLGIPGE